MKFSKLFGKFFIALVVPSLMISSCALLGLEEEEEKTETASASGDSGDDSGASIPELEGTWVKDCFVDDYGDIKIKAWVHTQSKLTVLDESYSDSGCLTQTMITEFSTIDIEKVSDTRLEGKYDDIKYTLTSSSTVQQFNDNGFCGSTDWELNVAKSVTGTNCGSGDSPGDELTVDFSVSGDTLVIDGDTFTKQ